jgi:anti-anti-sigma regulatory factor
VGNFDGFAWIRPSGKGSFVSSPALKSHCENRIAQGDRLLVVDLSDCSGMDSTFMGTLAGIASRLSAVEGGRLQIAEPGPRNRRSLEDLGLDFLMEIDPATAIWSGTQEIIRKSLQPLRQPDESGRLQRTKHVLDAHKALSDISSKNARSFASVIDTLEDEIAAKEKLAIDGESG